MSDFDISYFKNKLNDLSLHLNENQINQFKLFYDLLCEWNKVMNLTAITEAHEVIDKHFIDSLSVLNFIAFNKENTVIDVGTGAGFPGIPLAIVCPDVKFLLLDSLNKRVKFLNEVLESAGLKNVSVIHARAEDAGRDKQLRERFDFAVSRAVASLPVLLEYCTPFVKPGGYFISYKSGKGEEELKESRNALKNLSCEVEKKEEFILPETDNERLLLIFSKAGHTSRAYPRKAGTPSKKPL